METVGYFCSLNCALAWVNNLPESRHRKAYRQLIMFLCYRNYNYTWRRGDPSHLPIKPALPRSNLLLFGGHLSINQFRDRSGLVKTKKKPETHTVEKSRYKLKSVASRFGIKLYSEL